MLSDKVIKILGYVATAVSLGATLLGGYVSERKMEAAIDKKVNEALSQKNEEES